jgi:hypothetical protein
MSNPFGDARRNGGEGADMPYGAELTIIVYAAGRQNFSLMGSCEDHGSCEEPLSRAHQAASRSDQVGATRWRKWYVRDTH